MPSPKKPRSMRTAAAWYQPKLQNTKEFSHENYHCTHGRIDFGALVSSALFSADHRNVKIDVANGSQSTNRGVWRAIGPAPPAIEAAIGVHAPSHTIYIGSLGGGVLKVRTATPTSRRSITGSTRWSSRPWLWRPTIQTWSMPARARAFTRRSTAAPPGTSPETAGCR
jgi:hypothetical protein